MLSIKESQNAIYNGNYCFGLSGFGAFFMLVGSIGMVRLPDLFMRLHAPTKSSTLGLGSFLIASMIFLLSKGGSVLLSYSLPF